MNIKSVVDMLVMVASVVCYDSKISKAAITIRGPTGLGCLTIAHYDEERSTMPLNRACSSAFRP